MSDVPLTVREAARRLGVHENTVRNWQKKGIIGRTIVLPSGIRRFSAEDIQRMRDEMWSQFAPATVVPPMRTLDRSTAHLTAHDPDQGSEKALVDEESVVE